MYFISYVRCWKPANKKCGEMAEFVRTFEHKLIKDQCSLDALWCEIKRVAEELDAKYPKTAELCLDKRYGAIYCKTANSNDINVFSFPYQKVKGTYEFSEVLTNQIDE